VTEQNKAISMKKLLFTALFIFLYANFADAQDQIPNNGDDSRNAVVENLEEPMFKPFIERYILDEIKAIRADQQLLRAEVSEKIAHTQLSSSDRALRYTADTTNNIFYIITATASMLVLFGWKSLRDIKDNIEVATTNKISKLIEDYEYRLDEVEKSIKVRSDLLISTQEEISNTNALQSLWMRAGIEKNNQEKLKIYDDILEVNPGDIEALTYKADVLLDEGESKWALSLTDQAIECDSEYSLAYWQRACANASLGNLDEAIDDIAKSIELSPSFKEELEGEELFLPLKNEKRFKSLIG